MPPPVSVVMPSYNASRDMRQAVDSILGQSFRDFELLIVDDGSTDGTAEILEECEGVDPRVRVLYREHMGLVPTLNCGLEAARGKYVACMHADDVAFPDRLARQFTALEANPRLGMIGGAIIFINAEGVQSRVLTYPQTDKELRETLLHKNCFAHSSVTMRREAALSAGGYRQILVYGEDYDLWLRISERYEIANLPDPVLYYRIHPNQLSAKFTVQQVVSTAGARAAAGVRRATGRDPLAEGEPVTMESVQKLGVSAAELEEVLLTRYLSNARVMARCGYGEQALNMLQEARQIISATTGPRRQQMRRLYATYGVVHRRQGRWLSGFMWTLRSWLVPPSFLGC